MIKNTSLENLRELSHDWDKSVKNIIKNKEFQYLKSGKRGKNNIDKYRISILARGNWRGDGFGESRGEKNYLSPGRNQLLIKISGSCLKDEFNLGYAVDDFHDVVTILPGRLIRESMPNFNYANLENELSQIAEAYRNKRFDNNFLEDILTMSNNYISKLKL